MKIQIYYCDFLNQFELRFIERDNDNLIGIQVLKGQNKTATLSPKQVLSLMESIIYTIKYELEQDEKLHEV